MVSLGDVFSWTNLVIVAAVSAVAFCYRYGQKKYSFWSRQGIPGPTPWFPIGNMYQIFWILIGKPFHVLHKELITKYGKTVGSYQLFKPSMMTADPELIKIITVKESQAFPNRQIFKELLDETTVLFLSNMEGKDWKRVRSYMTPTFTSGKMKKMYQLMDTCARDAIDAAKTSQNTELKLKSFFGNYTLDVIARCCFATDPKTYDEQESQFVHYVKRIFKANIPLLMLYFLMPTFVYKNVLNLKAFPSEPIRYFEIAMKHLIKERRANENKTNDFLQLLLDDNDKSSLSDQEIIANSILFFGAGYETTGTLLSFLVYSLAVNQDIQEHLFNEVKSAGELSYEKVMTLPYLDAVVNETLRMYPPAVFIDRIAGQDFTFVEQNISIPKGTAVAIPSYAVHYDADNYPNPEQFDPKRFMPENKDKLVPYTFLPFGYGPRNCIGMRFALLEAKLLVAKMVLELEFVRTSQTTVPPKFKWGTLLTCEPLIVAMKSRK